MRLAVVVPTLNEAAHVEALVRRLSSDLTGASEGAPPATAKDQGAPAGDLADRVVVADGGSTDATLEKLAALQMEFAGLTVIHGPAGRGIQQRDGAAELLAELDDEDVLLFVHADNLPEPGALAALRKAAHQGGHAFAMRQHVDAEGDFYRAVERYAERRAARGRVYGDSCLAVRVGAYRAVGGFRPLALFEDLDLARRLAAQGPITLVDGAFVRVCARRWQKEGKTVTVVRNWLLTRGFELRLPPRLLAAFYPRHS